MAQFFEQLNVECPRCKAKPLEECKGPGLMGGNKRFHKERSRLVRKPKEKRDRS